MACGQQHTICRAVDRTTAQQLGEAVLVGSNCGADAYVWGSGTLGQLGLGKLIMHSQLMTIYDANGCE